jgi:hypothetical protein
MTHRPASPSPDGEQVPADRGITRPGTPGPTSRAAAQILRLLLDDPVIQPREVDWEVATGLAVRNGVLVRLASAVKRRGFTLPARLLTRAERARAHADHVLGLVAQVSQACERHGVPYVFLKLVQHYPDVGGTLELLVDASAKRTDQAVLDHVPALPKATHLRNRIAGTTTYAVPSYDTSIVVYHGRLGQVGEHPDLAQLVLRSRHRARLGFLTSVAPSTDEQLLLQAVRWAYGQTSLRLADLFWTSATLRAGQLQWAAVVRAAEATGLLAGLSCHLSYVEQIYRDVFGIGLLPEDLRQRIEGSSWEPLEFRENGYRQPGTRISGPVYAHQLRSRIVSGDWRAAGRLVLVPAITIAKRLRNLVRIGQGG